MVPPSRSLYPAGSHPNAMAYFKRLQERPSYGRVQREAEPYLHFFPQE